MFFLYIYAICMLVNVPCTFSKCMIWKKWMIQCENKYIYFRLFYYKIQIKCSLCNNNNYLNCVKSTIGLVKVAPRSQNSVSPFNDADWSDAKKATTRPISSGVASFCSKGDPRATASKYCNGVIKLMTYMTIDISWYLMIITDLPISSPNFLSTNFVATYPGLKLN